jgi:hypothetical protein
MKKIILSAIAGLFAVASAVAADVTLAWDPSPTNELVTAYVVYQATGTSTNFTPVLTVVNTNFTVAATATVTNLTPGVYKFYVTAKNIWNLESVPSNTVQTPAAKPSAPVFLLIRSIN